MPADGLRPQAESATALATAPGVERDIGVALIAAEVFRGIEIALVDRRDHRQHVHVFDLRAVLVADQRAILRAPGDPIDLGQWPAFGQFDASEIVFLAADEVDGVAVVEAFFRLHRHFRPDEADLDRRIALLDQLCGPDVLIKRRRRGVEDHQIAFVEFMRNIVPRQVVRRCVDQLRSFDHSGGLGQPGGIPEALDLALHLIARARAAVIAVERRGLEEKGAFHGFSDAEFTASAMRPSLVIFSSLPRQ